MELETRYARQGGAQIAFQVCGRGGWICCSSQVSSRIWTEIRGAAHTAYRSFVLRLSRMARVIRHDKRGNGLSDPVDSVPAMKQRCADAFAVLEAAGSTSAVVLGHCEEGLDDHRRQTIRHPAWAARQCTVSVLPAGLQPSMEQLGALAPPSAATGRRRACGVDSLAQEHVMSSGAGRHGSAPDARQRHLGRTSTRSCARCRRSRSASDGSARRSRSSAR